MGSTKLSTETVSIWTEADLSLLPFLSLSFLPFTFTPDSKYPSLPLSSSPSTSNVSKSHSRHSTTPSQDDSDIRTDLSTLLALPFFLPHRLEDSTNPLD